MEIQTTLHGHAWIKKEISGPLAYYDPENREGIWHGTEYRCVCGLVVQDWHTFSDETGRPILGSLSNAPKE